MYFHILIIVNNAVVNMEMQSSFKIKLLFSLDKHPGVELQDHMAVLFLVFETPSIQFSIVAAPVYIPINSVQVFPCPGHH